MRTYFIRNGFSLILYSLIMVGNISAYAADKETVEPAGNSLAAFEVFLQKKKDEIKAEVRRDNQNGNKFSPKEVVLNEMEKLIEFVSKVQTEETRAVQNNRLNPKITDYMTAKLFVLNETIRATFIKIFTGPLPVSISFPSELIQILSAIAADQPLSKEQVNYLRENSIPFDYYIAGDAYHGKYRKIRIGTSGGYGESFRRTSIYALGAIGKHQKLPFETLLILAEGMTDPLENSYVTEAVYKTLKTIYSDYSSFFSPDVNEKFEGLFTADINYWMDSDEIIDDVSKVEFMQRQWFIQSHTADLFTVIAKNKKIPSKLLTRMTNILFYQLDEAKLKEIRDLDFAVGMSYVTDNMSFFARETFQDHLNEQRDEALKNSQKRLVNLKIRMAESFGEIGRYQVLPDEVIQAMERLSSSEKEHPDVRKALQEALTSISEAKKSLTEKTAGSVCESSIRNSE